MARQLGWGRGDDGPWHVYADSPDPVTKKLATTACGVQISALYWEEAMAMMVPVDDRCPDCDRVWIGTPGAGRSMTRRISDAAKELAARQAGQRMVARGERPGYRLTAAQDGR